MSKGSTPRPYSINQNQFAENWDKIFKKDKDMQVRVNEEIGRCGCGRSPTGRCIGWHGLTEDEYRTKLKEYHEFDKKVIMKNEFYGDN
jgi:hypothetical protein